MCHRPTTSRPTFSAVILLASVLAGTALPAIASDVPPAGLSLWALELGVPDLERAVGFYTAALGFEVEATETDGSWALLGNGSARLALNRSEGAAVHDGSARAYPNFSVGDLAAAAKLIIDAGGTVEQPSGSPVGRAIRYLDPFGHPGHLIDHPWDELGTDAAPTVFNVALNVADMEASERFYVALGFEVSTRDYLPRTLVFKPRGSAQLILHPSAESATGPGSESGALLIDVDAGQAVGKLEIRDPSGILLKLGRQPPTEGAMETSLSAEQAADAFERLKRLAGEWQAKSTKGWDEVVGYEVVAGGSVVVETNSFKDAPEGTMYTMFHLDGERLLATHYCGSGNQPRLIASGVSDDGNQLTFTYLDATGIPSRDHGHMDQAVFRFLDADRFTARWTWYQEGTEQWLEEIEHRRLSSVKQAAAAL